MDDDIIGRLLISLHADDVEDARAAALADRVASYFTPNERLRYLGVAGIGRRKQT